MFSPIPFGFSKPNSCLILLFFFSYFHHLPCALSQPDLDPKFCDTLFHCGNITAGFPFWGAARPEPCGHPSLGLHCDQSKNVSLFIISGQMYRVLHIHIDNSTNTLGLARQDLLGETFCNSTLTGTTLTPELFELSPEYTTLFVYYLCEPHLPNPASFTCPQTGAAWVRQSNEIHENCAANYNITVSTCYVPEREAFNLTRLFSVLKEGFEVKLKIDKTPCQECKSTGGVCAYDRDTPVCCKTNSSSDIECSRMIPSVDERHQHCSPLFTCGNQIDLYYPFWTHDRAECGHPGFKVNCSNDGFAEFTTSSVKYRILEMNYTSSIIRLARMDYLDDLCPHSPENATLDQQVLPFSRDTEFLTFYYHCHGPRLDFPFNGHIRRLECEDDTGGQSFSVSSLFHIDVLRESCGRTVNIPVSRSALGKVEGNQSVEAVKKALREGFELNFNRDCSRCRKSDGACGYSQSLGGFVCYCIDGPHKHTCGQNGLSRNARIGIGFSCGFLGATLLVGGLLCFIVRRRKKLAARYTSKDLSTTSTYTTTNMGYRKRETSHHPRDHKLKALLQLKEYSYEEVKNITKSFSHTVGTGGFGTVYGGNLSNGRKVAVKVLKDFKSSGEDFINEVASMSQTSHVNIVSLLGFCYEGSKRAIVYEFLENGSLDQFISKKKSLSLSMSTLYGIALGVARGLEYLHHGCKTRIVHFDIKPQNILLDDDLCPKVSDFGLAKLCEKRESILSLLDTRGTVGYIAPEVFSGMYGRVSHKSDVYSYGMLVLEMIGARNKETVETAASNPSSTYFPDWIYKGLENEEHTWVIGYATTEEKEIAKKMILVGLWCIQPCPSNRPPMNRVFEMMAGSLDAIEVPPKPSLHLSPVPLSESPWLSEENSNYSEVLI